MPSKAFLILIGILIVLLGIQTVRYYNSELDLQDAQNNYKTCQGNEATLTQGIDTQNTATVDAAKTAAANEADADKAASAAMNASGAKVKNLTGNDAKSMNAWMKGLYQ